VNQSLYTPPVPRIKALTRCLARTPDRLDAMSESMTTSQRLHGLGPLSNASGARLVSRHTSTYDD
jgi:hypothetical protein